MKRTFYNMLLNETYILQYAVKWNMYILQYAFKWNMYILQYIVIKWSVYKRSKAFYCLVRWNWS